MVDALTAIYLIYAFIAFYFLFLFLLVYWQNKEKIWECPKAEKILPLSVVVPCYNEEKTIEKTVISILNSDYPGLKKIYVVDDCSTDGSYEKIKKLSEKYKKVVALQTPKNTGKASGAKNYGAKFVKTELIGFVDADSFPEKKAISKAVGFFNDDKVAGVTVLILVKNRDKFIEKLQAIEYKSIAFTRKLLGFLDAIYVMPGPLAIYRKKIFDEAGGFDEKNLTEDIELTWNIVSRGYKVEMSTMSKVFTVVPTTLKEWYKQRIRWNIGGIQTINKYKSLFLTKGSLGSFILPFFVGSTLIGLIGFGILVYNLFQRLVVQYLSTVYSIEAQTAILALREINLTPSVLFFFGIVLFFLGLAFTLFILAFLREKEFKKHTPLEIAVYTLFYLTIYALILIISIYNYLKGRYSW